MSGKPNPGQIVVGLFLSLAGAAIILPGGGCTIALGLQLVGLSPGGADPLVAMLMLVSLAGLAVGLVCLWAGVKMFRGDRTQGDAPPEGGEEG